MRIGLADGRLTVTVADDGYGGADPAAGTGLRGIQRRLAAFDGGLTIDSPVMDPEVIARLLTRVAVPLGPSGRLSPREREVLELMAEGRSNAAIAQCLFITERAVGGKARSAAASTTSPPMDRRAGKLAKTRKVPARATAANAQPERGH